MRGEGGGGRVAKRQVFGKGLSLPLFLLFYFSLFFFHVRSSFSYSSLYLFAEMHFGSAENQDKAAWCFMKIRATSSYFEVWGVKVAIFPSSIFFHCCIHNFMRRFIIISKDMKILVEDFSDRLQLSRARKGNLYWAPSCAMFSVTFKSKSNMLRNQVIRSIRVMNNMNILTIRECNACNTIATESGKLWRRHRMAEWYSKYSLYISNWTVFYNVYYAFIGALF